MGLALGPPRLPDPDRDVPCRPGVALVAKRPHLRETERLSAGATAAQCILDRGLERSPALGAFGGLGAEPRRPGIFGARSTNETAPVSFLTGRNLPDFRMQKPTASQPPASRASVRQLLRRGAQRTVCPLAGRRVAQRVGYKRSATAARRSCRARQPSACRRPDTPS